MAESTAKKGSKQSIDSFADDLDSMLGVDELSQQQVGLIDDDDAIDRLLMGDVFPDDDFDQAGSSEDIDKLLEERGADKSQVGVGDEFSDDIDDLIAGFDINARRQAVLADESIAEMAELEADAGEVDLSALENVGLVDEFDDDLPVLPSIASETVVEPRVDEFESMTEIDEFSDLPASAAVDNADFLLADFNISVDDDVDLSPEPVAISQPSVELPSQPEPAPAFVSEPVIASAPAAVDDFADDDLDVDFVLTPPSPPAVSVAEVAHSEVEVEEAPQPQPQPVATAQIDHSAELAALTAQITALKKQQQQAKHEFELKADKQELTDCLNAIDSLQTEQKKSKRNLDAVVNKKPVGIYVANGVAALAMLVAVGLWIDSFITKSQVEQLVVIVGQLKQQLEAAPTADAADKELMRKQLDDLTVAQSVATAQIAELSKGVSSDSGAQKPTGDVGKQLSDLSNQDMQMGSAIETLQNKVAALEKGKTAAVAAVPKPVVKKPVIEENWAVNLVAFKQDWYAKRKAEEFASKGVPAKVSRTESKGETWYRLSVDGFSSQYEAAAFAAKVKKTLNLDSVWVARNKD